MHPSVAERTIETRKIIILIILFVVIGNFAIYGCVTKLFTIGDYNIIILKGA